MALTSSGFLVVGWPLAQVGSQVGRWGQTPGEKGLWILLCGQRAQV